MVDLILEMKRLGHPSFAGLDEALVRQRAEALPEDGVPKEVLKVIEEVDDSHDRLQPQKAATPCDGRQPLAAAGQAFAAQRPRTVEPQGRSNRPQQELVEAALKDLTKQLTSPGDMPALRTLEARAGNRLIDQFQPYYWSMAFCFLFKYATAQPDVSNTSHGANEEPQELLVLLDQVTVGALGLFAHEIVMGLLELLALAACSDLLVCF